MAGVNNITAAGFGSWSSVEFVPTLGFGISTAAVFVPVVHYHTLEGPSKKTHILTGSQRQLHILEGPSKQTKILVGSN